MAWSYRSDIADETYHAAGVHLVEGTKLPETPADAQHVEDMLKPETAPKGVTTQFQEYPGQNVPRIIEGEGETKKDKEIVAGVKAEEARQKQVKKETEKQAANTTAKK
jgi:hypothetical protein